jgi:hypothetical protein
MLKECKIHGISKHYQSNGRCKKCNVMAVTRRRKEIKIRAIEYLGGKCIHCGLKDPCPAIYDFHHIDSSKKDFLISRSNTYSWNKTKEELDKCKLLCSNCHRKEHYKKETFPIKHIKKEAKQCPVCNKKIQRRNKTCNKCMSKDKINWPTNEQLIQMLSKSNYSALSRELGVSDNAIRKRLNRLL